MSKALKSLGIGASFLAIAAAQQAQALSIRDFFNTVSENAQPDAVRIALTTEAERNWEAGRHALANCMEEKIIPRGSREPLAFRKLHISLMDSANDGGRCYLAIHQKSMPGG